MAHTENLFFSCFVRITLCYNILFIQKVSSTEIKGNLPEPSIISRIFNQFLGPVMKSFPGNNFDINNIQETLVDKTIREKLKELQPLLQDNDKKTDDENITLEDKDDTTIIEFLPKTKDPTKKLKDNKLKEHLIKYKKLREKINNALTKESVSGKTKNFVVKALDGLMKTLLSSQCNRKRNLRVDKSETPWDLANKWNYSLQNIKHLLFTFIENKSVQTRRNDDVLKFLEAFQIMFKSIAKDIDIISRKYKISCEFVPKEHIKEMNALRNNWDKSDLEEDRCHNVIVCSKELREFMRSFYHALNDTIVSVVKNYKEMYTRDVTLDNEIEKDVIISILNRIITGLEGGTEKVFVKETQKLMLDKNKKNHENVNILSNYVTDIIKNVQNFAKQTFRSELLVLRERILSVILDDLNVNLDVDLGNLEREFVRKICEMFHICNSEFRGRRQGFRDTDKNNIHVHVQLALTNGMEDTQSNGKLLNPVTSRNGTVNRFTSSLTNVTVTRTTLINNVTKYYTV